jgi:hypothetical protein
MAAMNIRPTSAATGTFSMREAPNNTKSNNAMAATVPDICDLRPELTLMML